MKEKGPLPLTSFAELTLEAMADSSKRLDWDWVVCLYIRQWERRLEERFAEAGRPLTHGRFAWYNWRAICDRVLARAGEEMGKLRNLVGRADSTEGSEYTRHLLSEVLCAECEDEFGAVARKLQERGLRLCAEPEEGVE